MNQYQPRIELKDRAKDILTGKYVTSILLLFMRGMFVMFLSNLALSLGRQFSGTLARILGTDSSLIITGAALLISLLASILTAVFNVGFTLFFLNLACNKPVNPFYLFYGFQQDFGKSFGISAVLVLVDTICLAPFDIITNHITNTHTLSAPWMPVMAIALIIGFVVRIPLSLGLSQCYFLMLDFPNYSISQILKLSFRVMNGHKKRLFLIELSFLPLMLINVFSWGIGGLWLTPYMNMVHTLFFLDLMNPKKEI